MSLRIDLHSHSNISDGLLTPVELVAHAATHHVDVLALTDHDDTSGLEMAAIEAKRLGLQLINGVEISVTWKRRTLHIVGLKIDPEYPAIKVRFGSYSMLVVMCAQRVWQRAWIKQVSRVVWKVLITTRKRVLSVARILHDF